MCVCVGTLDDEETVLHVMPKDFHIVDRHNH